jgi:predicted  nucleic acid-binding Zn-ribbon protein
MSADNLEDLAAILRQELAPIRSEIAAARLELQHVAERAHHLSSVYATVAEEMVALRLVVHEYQKSVESTIDKQGARMHARLESMEQWREGTGGGKEQAGQ